MSAWIVHRWQAKSGRIAVGLIAVGAIMNLALLSAVGFGVLYEVGRGVGWAYAHLG